MVLIPFDITQTDVTVALYGGILQNRQRCGCCSTRMTARKIHEGAPQAVLYGLMEELRARGFKVRLAAPGETADTEPPPETARVTVKLSRFDLTSSTVA